MAIKELRKTWSDCQLDYVREFIVTKETDVEKLPACCVGSTCVVSETNNRYVCGQGRKWKKREEAMEDGCGLTWADLGESKTVETVLPETELTFIIDSEGGPFPWTQPAISKTIEGGDDLSVLCDGVEYRCKTVAVNDDIAFFGNIGLIGEGQDTGEPFVCIASIGSPFVDIMLPNAEDGSVHTFAIYKDAIEYNPIPAEYLPAGCGVKTAIIKQIGYDAYLNGTLESEPDESWKYECENMTRDEAIQTIMNGEPLEAIVFSYDYISGCGGWRGAVRYPVRYRPANDNLSVNDIGGWYDDGIYQVVT